MPIDEADVDRDRRWHGTDHDLLVRIDERLLGIKDDLNSALIQLAGHEARIKSLEESRSERAGADKVTARTLALIMSGVAILASTGTAIAIKIVEKLL